MYNEELESLIEAAVTDGEVTAKERSVLLKKAESMGVNLDEFEMVLDSRLQKKQQELKAAATPAPSSGKYGDIRKCPACGAAVNAFVTKCPECGHEFTNVQAVASSQRLFAMLQEAARKNTEQVQKNEEERQRRLKEVMDRYNSQSTASKLLLSSKNREKEIEEVNEAMDQARLSIEKNLTKEKQNIIKMFPVPNSKEDLIELLSMSTSSAYDNDGVIGPEEEVWIQKCDQIYSKVKAISAREKDTQFIDMATEMIISLMSRLPKAYKNFTEIDARGKDKLKAANAASKQDRKRQAFDIMKIWGTANILSWIVLIGTILSLMNGGSNSPIVALFIVIIIAIISIIFTNKIKNKKLKEEGLKWNDMF